MSYSSPIQREEWNVDMMNAFLTKLGFISADKQAVQGLQWYQHIYKVSPVNDNAKSLLLTHVFVTLNPS